MGRSRALGIASDAGEDLVGRLGPNEGFGSLVVHVDVLTDSEFEVLHTAKNATPNPFVGEFGEPSFHQVDPRPVRGGEVDMKSRAFGKPFPDENRFVRAVI